MSHKRMSLQHKTMFIVALPLTIMVCMGLYFGLLAASKARVESLTIEMEERTARQAAELDLFFSNVSRNADNLAQTLTALSPLPVPSVFTLAREVVSVTGISSCAVAYTVDPNTGMALHDMVRTRRIEGRIAPALISRTRLLDYINTDWFLMPQLAGKGMWTDPFYVDDLHTEIVCYGSPIFQEGKFLGVAAVSVELDSIRTVLNSINTVGSQLVLVSQYGTIVSHPDAEYALRYTLTGLANEHGGKDLQQFANDMRNLRSFGMTRLEDGILGDKEYIAYAAVGNADWVLLSIVPEATVMRPLQRSFILWVLSSILGALCLFAAIYLLGKRKVVVPLQRLTVGTNRLARGEFRFRVAETSDTVELWQLEKAFNSMAAQLESSLLKEIEAGKAKSYAEEASRAKSDFLARMSHEIRTPMNAVMGFAHIALSRDPDTEQRNFLLKIQSAGKNMLSIINDILDFSKIEAGMLELERVTFSLKDLVADLYSIFEHSAKSHHLDFRVEVDSSLPDYLVGDPLRITQVFMNLCNNAFKFTDQGHIIVRFSLHHREGSRLMIRGSVEDTGMGISQDAQAKLFTKFTQADTSTTRRFGGTGLGLAICRLLAELMGGSIALTSREGEGSEFVVYFTCDEGRAQDLPLSTTAIASDVMDLPVECRLEARVLVAEDNEINQEIIASMLESLNIPYDIANDGAEAVRMVEASFLTDHSYALVLMDMQMPIMDGIGATRYLREHGYTLPIIAMTANALPADRDNCLREGMNGHIPKPVEPMLLRAALGYWIESTCVRPDSQ